MSEVPACPFFRLKFNPSETVCQNVESQFPPQKTTFCFRDKFYVGQTGRKSPPVSRKHSRESRLDKWQYSVSRYLTDSTINFDIIENPSQHPHLLSSHLHRTTRVVKISHNFNRENWYTMNTSSAFLCVSSFSLDSITPRFGLAVLYNMLVQFIVVSNSTDYNNCTTETLKDYVNTARFKPWDNKLHILQG